MRTCSECDNRFDELVSADHAPSCSLHPDNVLDMAKRYVEAHNENAIPNAAWRHLLWGMRTS
jgi:hypothetical protein